MRLNNIVTVALLSASFSHAATENAPLSGLNLKDFREVEEHSVDWKNNPFVQQTEDINIANLVLAAILFHETDASALINGEIVRVGDEIGSSKVVAIHRHDVLLRNESGVFELQLKGKKNENS